MRLNDALVTSFVYDGKKYEIDLSFDNVLDVFDVLDDKNLRDYEKVDIGLSLLLGDYECDDIISLWNYIFDNFITFADEEEPVEYDLLGNPMPKKNDSKKVKSIDFEKDAEYIFASFKQAYNINLLEEQGKMHWHEFKALLVGLPQNTIMKWIMSIRTWEPSKGDSSEYKSRMRELQKLYALDDDDEGEEVDE